MERLPANTHVNQARTQLYSFRYIPILQFCTTTERSAVRCRQRDLDGSAAKEAPSTLTQSVFSAFRRTMYLLDTARAQAWAGRQGLETSDCVGCVLLLLCTYCRRQRGYSWKQSWGESFAQKKGEAQTTDQMDLDPEGFWTRGFFVSGVRAMDS